MAGFTSGGEQQMTAVGRALMARPSLILLDEPSMGLAPQVVEEILGIVRSLNRTEGVSFLLAEQNAAAALRFADHGYILEAGRVVMDGDAATLAGQRGREGVLPGARRGRAEELPRREALPTAQALAGLRREEGAHGGWTTRASGEIPEERERALMKALPAVVSHAFARAPVYRRRDPSVVPEEVTDRGALAKLRLVRKSELPEIQRADPPFGGLWTVAAPQAAKLFSSPGPVFELEPRTRGSRGGQRGRCVPPGSAPATWCTTASPTT